MLIYQNGNQIVTQGNIGSFFTQDDNDLVTQDDLSLEAQQNDDDIPAFLIAQQDGNTGFGPLSLPHVDLSISTDGGATFGNEWAYVLPAIGHRKNRLLWWQCGIANDFVAQFKFWGMGRFVATDGIANVRK